MNTGVKVLLWALGGLIALIVIAVIGLKLFFPVEKIKAIALEKATVMLQRPIGLDQADLSIWGGLGVRLENVSVGNPQGFAGDPFFAAKSVDVKVAFWPLLSGKVQVKRLVIESPAISMHKLSNGTTNYTFASVDSAVPGASNIPAEAKPAAAAIAFDALEIHNGLVRFVDDSADRQISATGLSLQTSVASPTAGVHDAKGRLAIDTVLSSFMQKLPLVDLTLDYQGTFDLNQKSLALENIKLGVNGLLFEITGKLTGITESMTADVRIKTDRVSAADLLKLLPPDKLAAMADFTVNGNFAFDANAVYDSARTPALAYSGTATISDLTMTRKGIDGELKIKRIPVEFAVDRVKLNIENGLFAGQPFSGNLAVENSPTQIFRERSKEVSILAFSSRFCRRKVSRNSKGRPPLICNSPVARKNQRALR